MAEGDDVLGYGRVSTDEQAKDGESLDDQVALITSATAAAGEHLVDVVLDDGRSAKNLRRRGIQDVLARLRAGEASTLRCTKLDRLTRRPADLELLLERHFDDKAPHRLMLVKEPHDAKTPVGRMTLRILCAVAQLELDQTSERVNSSVAHKQRDHRVVGGVPLGFDRQGDQLVPNAGELAVLERIKDLRGAGKGPREIARLLAAEGHKTKKGGIWRACTVVKLIDRLPSE